jgi:hypothetical protein
MRRLALVTDVAKFRMVLPGFRAGSCNRRTQAELTRTVAAHAASSRHARIRSAIPALRPRCRAVCARHGLRRRPLSSGETLVPVDDICARTDICSRTDLRAGTDLPAARGVGVSSAARPC